MVRALATCFVEKRNPEYTSAVHGGPKLYSSTGRFTDQSGLIQYALILPRDDWCWRIYNALEIRYETDRADLTCDYQCLMRL